MDYIVKINNVDVTNYLYDGTLPEKLNDEFDTGTIIIKNDRKEAYEADLRVDIAVIDGDLITKQFYYLVSSDISKLIQTEDDTPDEFYRHEIQLIELTYYQTQQVEMTTRSFTQQKTGVKFPLYDVVKSIQETTPTVSFVDDLDDNILWLIDGDNDNPSFRTSIAKRLTDIQSPNFVFENKSQFEMLSIIFGYIKAIPRLIRNISGKKLLIGDFVNEFGELVDFETPSNNREERMNINQVSTSLEFVLNNAHYDNSTANIVLEPVEGEYKKVTSRTAGNFTDQTAILGSLYPIEVVTSLKALAVGSEAGFPFKTEVDITDFVYEKSVYDNLPTSKGQSFQSGVKESAIYYNFGKQDVEGLFIEYGFVTGYALTNIIRIAYRDAGGNPADIDTNLEFYNYELQLEYESRPNTVRHRVYKIDNSRINRSTQRIANQNDRSLSTARAIDQLQLTLQQLGNPQVTTDQHIKLLNDGFNIGDYTSDNYVNTVKEWNLRRDDIFLRHTWSQGYQKLTNFASLNAEERFYDVPPSTYQRNVIYEDFIEFSETDKPSSSTLSTKGKSVLMNILQKNPQPLNDDPIQAVLFNSPDSRDYEDNTESIVLPVSKDAGRGCINIYWEIDDPIVVGNQLSFVSGGLFPDKPILQAVKYTADDGELTSYSSKYINKYTVADANLLPVIPKSDASGILINESEDRFKVLLDLSEKLSETRAIQCYPELLNKFVIGDYFLHNNNLIKLYNGIYPDVKIVKGNINYNESDPFYANDDSVDTGLDWLLTGNRIILGSPITDANSYAIVVDGTNELILGVNQNLSGSIVAIDDFYINDLDMKAGVINED
jgi:hypothetical protein